MPAILTDPEIPAEDLRQRLYSGDLIILTRLNALAEFVDYLREELAVLFAPHDPERAHEYIEPAEMAKILGVWKPRWIHAARSQDLVRAIITEAGFAPEYTHYDVPKPRTSFPMGHLTTGIAFAFPWHRDVWYSAPAQQINWWLPVFPVRETNAMSFDLANHARAVPNTSGDFDYYENNAHRVNTAKSVGKEAQSRPGAIDHTPDLEVIPVPAPGQILLFSGAQLHKSIPNTSGLARYSVDFRTVDTRDVRAGRGAVLADADCTGTAIRDFISVKDQDTFDEDLVRSLYGAPPRDAMLVFGRPVAALAALATLAESHLNPGRIAIVRYVNRAPSQGVISARPGGNRVVITGTKPKTGLQECRRSSGGGRGRRGRGRWVGARWGHGGARRRTGHHGRERRDRARRSQPGGRADD